MKASECDEENENDVKQRQQGEEDHAEDWLNNLFVDDSEDTSNEKSLPRKRKASEDLNEDDVKQRQKEKKKYKWRNNRKKKNQTIENSEGKKMIKPNYFVGIRVSNPEIHRMVKMVQESVLGMEAGLKSALVSIPKLHLTLALAHLSDMDSVSKAAEIVEKCAASHKEFFNNSVSLHFKGLETFRHRVLFVHVEEGEVLARLRLMADDLQCSFDELTGRPGIKNKEFSPHLTILKLSKDIKLRKKGIHRISNNLYSNMTDTVFGSQVISGIELLSMNKPMDAGGYYYCSHHVAFEVSKNESEDHTECCIKPLAVKPFLPNVSEAQRRLCIEKDMIKRRFHSLSVANLSSIPDRNSQSENQSGSTLKTLMLVGAVAFAMLAIARNFSSSK